MPRSSTRGAVASAGYALIASLGFGPIELFSMPDTEREVPKVALR